jgi:hypothetical protein
MPCASRSPLKSLGIAVLLILLTPHLSASPLFPGVIASRSANGSFLVIVRLHFKDPNATSGAVTGATFEIAQIEPAISQTYGLRSSSTFYNDLSYTSWQVTVTGALSSLHLPIVSDDGQSLLLLAVATPDPALPVLTIYRKHDHQGSLDHAYSLTELWTEQELYPQGRDGTLFGDFGSNPKWFAADSFQFTPDNQTLLYTTKWSDRLALNLTNGSISRLPTSP